MVILACTVVLGMLLNGAKNGEGEFGSGLKAIMAGSQTEAQADPEIAELIENKSTEKEFDFYVLLRDIEKVMPDDLPEALPNKTQAEHDFYLQAASFREHSDAEKLRARLALKGYSSVTQARDIEGKGTYYRVRLGPYADKRKAKTAKNRLQALGVRPFVYSVKKTK